MTTRRLSLRLVASISLVVPMSLGGCAQHYASPQQAAANACSAFGPGATSGALIGGLTGAAGGAAIGGLAGHSGTAALIGAGAGLLAGLLVGGAIGHNVDAKDCAAARVALQNIENAPVGQRIPWSDPSTGSSGYYVPTAAAYTNEQTNEICRPVSASYYLNGHKPVEDDTGNVCRDANGGWAFQAASS